MRTKVADCNMTLDISNRATITVLNWPFNQRRLCHMAEVDSHQFSFHNHSAKKTRQNAISLIVPSSLLQCSSHHVVDDVDVIGDPSHLVTLLHVCPLWISRSQNGGIRVSLTNSSRSSFHLHVFCTSQDDHSQAPGPSGWTSGQTSSRWTREQSFQGWWPRNIDPKSTNKPMLMQDVAQ